MAQDRPKLIRDDIIIAYTTDREAMAKAAAEKLDGMGVTLELIPISLKKFACSEYLPRVSGNVRGRDVFLFQGFGKNPNVDIWNFLLTLDALHLADAKSITPVIPYIPYLRQDRKDKSRVPISASRIIRSIEMCPGVKRVITTDMHADQLQAVFTIPVDHIPGRVFFIPWARERFKNDFSNVVAVAPDIGSVKRVRSLAKRLDDNMSLAILDKERTDEGVEVHTVIGDSVQGKICLINDDIVDTGGTLKEAIDALMSFGPREVIVTVTHPVFSKSNGTTAYEKLMEAGIELITTDSIPTENHSWLTVLPLTEYMAQVIFEQISRDGSVSKIIEEGLPQ